METIINVGADVHKDTNSVCMFDWNDGSFFAEAVIEPGVENMIKYIEKARKEYGLGKDCRFLVGYEAGPTGYGLCRGLQKKGYECVIMAPTTIKKSSSDKRKKTDRRDAKMLAMALATDTYRRVYVLDDEDEGTREFTRARNSMLRELKKAKQMLLSFLLRIGRSYPDSGNYWTRRHREWLDSLKFEDRKLNHAYQSYLQQVKDLESKLALMDEEIENIADEERYKNKVDRLVCFKGIDTQTALTLVVEIGDFERFATEGRKLKGTACPYRGSEIHKKKQPLRKVKAHHSPAEGTIPGYCRICRPRLETHQTEDGKNGSAWQEQERIYNSRSKGACVLRMGNDDRQHCLRQIEARERT